MKKTHWLIACIATIFTLTLIIHPSLAQEDKDGPGGQQYFPETGHYVAGEFYQFYKSIPNAELVFGPPLTEAFLEPSGERFLQYFQRARFELHPAEPPDLRIKVTELGTLLYKPELTLQLPENLPTCQHFVETGKQVCYAFLDFFKSNGGEKIFGFPISNFEIHDSRIVQYFQRAIFEWHPELEAGKRVVLADVGDIYFKVIGENPVRKNPRKPPQISDNTVRRVLNLRVRAFTRSAILPRSGDQTVYVIVQDQLFAPVADARVTMDIFFPNGDVIRNQPLPSTNARGVTSLTFQYHGQTIGQVIIKVKTTTAGHTKETSTSFRIWW